MEYNTYRLCPRNGLPSGVGAHARQRPEGVVRQHVDAPVVRLEVVDLLLEYERPQVLTHELDGVQRIGEAWAVAGEAVLWVWELVSQALMRRAGFELG